MAQTLPLEELLKQEKTKVQMLVALLTVRGEGLGLNVNTNRDFSGLEKAFSDMPILTRGESLHLIDFYTQISSFYDFLISSALTMPDRDEKVDAIVRKWEKYNPRDKMQTYGMLHDISGMRLDEYEHAWRIEYTEEVIQILKEKMAVVKGWGIDGRYAEPYERVIYYLNKEVRRQKRIQEVLRDRRDILTAKAKTYSGFFGSIREYFEGIDIARRTENASILGAYLLIRAAPLASLVSAGIAIYNNRYDIAFPLTCFAGMMICGDYAVHMEYKVSAETRKVAKIFTPIIERAA